MEALQTECRRRLDRPVAPERIHYSKFYPNSGAWHHIYGIPLYSAEELLVVENLMYHGGHEEMRFDRYVAGYKPANHGEHEGKVKVESWQPLRWDPVMEVFVLGPDEGPRTLDYTSFE